MLILSIWGGGRKWLPQCGHTWYTFVACPQRVRSAGIRSAVLLLTNDQGLCVRAEANAVKCYTAQQLPKDPQVLAQVRWRRRLLVAVLGLPCVLMCLAAHAAYQHFS